jgi:Putative auto-transporter adhesin, head GIN domain
MKKTVFKNIMLFFLPVFILYGCVKTININDPVNGNSIHGSGNLVSQPREITECNGIKVLSIGNIYLTQDNTQKIRVEADDNIIDYVTTKEQNGILLVGLKNGSYSDVTLNVYVSLKTIKNLSIEGSGSIISQNSISTDLLSSVIDGSGNINIKGQSNYLYGVINGSGNINAEKLTTIKCDAVVNGSGICTLNVTDELNAAINGSGTIIIYGNPVNVNSSITGSGSIISK